VERLGTWRVAGRLKFTAGRVVCLVALGVAASFLLSSSAFASIKVSADARGPALRVDTAGNAEVTWTTTSGARESVVISKDGLFRYGAALPGADVSHPITSVSIPWEVTVRQTADGSLYALQSWQRLATGPVELRFSRWKGEPTTLTLHTVCCKWGHENVEGAASFHGKGIFGFHSTHQGDPLDPFGRNVYLDSYRAGHWDRMMGILTHAPAGSFSLWIRPEWLGSQYRGTISGPNWGWTLGPDAEATARSSEH
jgi:hypothetical protein